MSQQLFSAGVGIELVSADFTGRTHLLTGTGTPGGDGSHQDDAPLGSLYCRQDSEIDGLQIYMKNSVINNNINDWSQTTDKAYVDAVAQGLSWREPVRVLDNTIYATVAALPVTGTIDGVVLADEDRVLFGSITVGNNNVYVWNLPGLSWSEDVNLATDGDAVLVQEGTFSEQQWVNDGTGWVQFGGAASQAELEFIRTFIGKTTSGAETPTYATNNIVTSGQNLEISISDLDAAIGDRIFTNDNVVVDGEAISSSIDKLDVALGDRLYSQDNVVIDGQSISASVDALDVAVGVLQSQNVAINVPNVTTSTVVDSIPVANADNVEWRIVVENAGDSTNRLSTIVNALHDGTVVDYSRFATNKRGANISGLAIDVQINGGNIELILTSITAIDVGVKRMVTLVAN